MRQIDKCNNCKYLQKLTNNCNDTYYVCDELKDFLWVETDTYGYIRIDYPDTFGCIAWEAKEELNG